MNILNKKADAGNGEGFFLLVALNIINERAAAQVELIFRYFSLVKKRNDLIIFQLLSALSVGIIGYAEQNHKRNKNIGQQSKQLSFKIARIVIFSIQLE